MVSKPTEITAAAKRLLDEMSASFPELLREQSELVKRLNEVNAKVGAHRAMFQAYGMPVPIEAVTQGSTVERGDILRAAGTLTNIITLLPSGRSQRGKIKGHIDEALRNGPMKVQELRNEISRLFRIQYGVSSLYRILKIGLQSKEYKVSGGRWELR